MKVTEKFLVVLLIIFVLGLSACGKTSQETTVDSVENPDGGEVTPGVIPTDTVEPSPTPEIVVATINGDRVTISLYNIHLAQLQQTLADSVIILTEEEQQVKVMDELVERALLSQYARQQGFTAGDELVTQRVNYLINRLGSQEALDAWLNQFGYTSLTFAEDLKLEVEAAWARDQIVSQVPATAEQVEAREIFFDSEADAYRVITQLEGGSTFQSRIDNYDPQNLGYLGWFPRGYLFDQVLEDTAFSLNPGEYSEVIQTGGGYHIIEVISKQVDRPLTADAYLTLQENALEAWLTQQKEKSQIEIIYP